MKSGHIVFGITVKPEIFACPVFCKFCNLSSHENNASRIFER